MPHFHRRALLAASLALALPFAAVAQGKGDIKIALLAGKTGPLEAYAKQTRERLQHGARIRSPSGTMTDRAPTSSS